MSGPLGCSRVTAAQRARLEDWISQRGSAGDAARRIARRPAGAPATVSLSQERLWFFSQYDRRSPLYNVPVAIRLDGPLNREAARLAIGAIVARHEPLRTRFLTEDGSPRAVIDPPSAVDLPCVERAGEAALEAALAEECRRPFDLARDPLVRARLFRMGPEEHVLAVTKHHVASDGWSENVFLREFAKFYAQFSGGPRAGLPGLPIAYADFAHWQREHAAGSEVAAQLDYWRRKLAGAAPILELPCDRPRPARMSFRGGWRTRALPSSTIRAAQALARERGATLFMTLCAAFQTFLHRYSGAADFLVGTPVAGRSHVETEPLIGLFVNTLPLRAQFRPGTTFAEIVEQAKESILGALANQEAPFERIVEAVQPARTPSHLPLLQVLFVFRGATFDFAPPAGLAMAAKSIDTGTSKFDLTLNVDETPDGWIASFEYASDLFAPSTVDRMLDHFLTVLDAAIRLPSTPVAELPLLGPEERRRMVVDWNAAAAALPAAPSLAAALREQAERTPGRTALIWRDQPLSYREWHARAAAVAQRLTAVGVGPGSLVAACLERSAGLAIVLLGILQAGAAYLPLDPAYPDDRLRFMLDDAKPAVLVTQPQLAAFRTQYAGVVLEVDEAGEIVASGGDSSSALGKAGPPSGLPAEPDGRDPRAGLHAAGADGPRPDDPAYVIYTSGSTGRPKGIVVTHRNVINFFAGMDGLLGADPGIWLGLASISFDVSVLELWWTLSRGSTVVLVDEEDRLGAPLAGYLERHGVTHVQCTPSFARVLLEIPELRRSLRAIRTFLIGGEALGADLARGLLNSIGGDLYNVYGPTETTVWASAHRVERREVEDLSGAKAAAAGIPIGRPLANVQLYVVDGRLEPCPAGVPGEIVIGGGGVSPGYFRRPELTERRFVPDPFRPGGRLYRTGDLGRFRSDGTLEFLGRADFQIKLRGHRIELGEIEAVLREHPAVHACVAVVRESAAGDQRIVAYVVPRPGTPGDADAWRRHLAGKLPGHMVPAAFAVLPGLPLTPTGKIDRTALPPVETESSDAGRGPASEWEARLLPLWEQALESSPLAVTDNFFACGGHSLLAVRLAARIEAALEVSVPVSAIYESPTVELLARRLGGDAAAAGTELAVIQGKGFRPGLFLVHGIGSGMLWGYANLSSRLAPDQPVYAFKSRALDGGAEFDSIEAMAAHYVSVLVRFQPDGPYWIGGYCFGGNVAHEMACQLHEQGREVRLLALFNSYAQNSAFTRMRWTPRSLAAFVRNAALLVGEFARGEVGSRKQYLRWKLRRAVHALRTGPGGGFNPDEIVDLTTFPPAQWPLLAAHAQALRQHRTKVFPGTVTLFRTPGYPPFCSFDPDYGWGEFAGGGVVLRIVPGKHDTMMEERHVGRLAEELKPFLAR